VKKMFAGVVLLLSVAAPVAAQEAPAPEQAAPAAAEQVVPQKGKMLLSAEGSRLAPVYRVADSGPQIILDGRMVTVPSNTLKVVDGKLTTSLSKREVLALR
jgi:hypothetical protein